MTTKRRAPKTSERSRVSPAEHDDPRVAELVAAKMGKLFDPGHGRLMKRSPTRPEAEGRKAQGKEESERLRRFLTKDDLVLQH